MNRSDLAALCLSTAILLLTAPASQAQNGLPQVSMVTLQVVQNQDGSQSVITPKGDLATLPGAGVNGNTAVIYMGTQGGFWYTDKTGQNVSLDATVNALQARRAANQQTAQVPQYAPEPYSSGTGSGVRSAVGTAAAAGMGAMAGAAMSNHYYNAPYGTPMYYGAGHPYSYGNGERIEELNSDQKAALQNHYQTQQQNKQQALQQGQTNRQARLEQTGSNQQSRQQSVQQNQANRQSQIAQSGGQQQNYQRQQQWYQNQLKENPKQFQKASNNPFVSQSRGGREASGQRSSMRAERSGRGGSARGGGGGGRSGGGRRR